MKATDFELYRALLKEKSGLIVTPDKTYLLDSRLGPVAKKRGFTSLEDMTAALRGKSDPTLVTDIVEAMTTNETSFFRDTRPFQIFTDFVLPAMTQSAGRTARKSLRIWCAAASSGQEPYSLAMLLEDNKAKYPGWRFDIIGTDISHEILDIARNGSYSQFEVQRGLPIQMLMNYFTQVGERWQLKEDIRKKIQYKYFNLLEDMTSMGKFDIIFCRNVLIYFDEPTKRQILERMAKILEKDGFLFLGGAETVISITDTFIPMPGQRGLYVLKDSVHAEAAKATRNAATPPLASGAASA